MSTVIASEVDPALGAVREAIRAAAAEGRSLRLVGGGTKDFYGEAGIGEALDLRALRGIVSYEPTELVLQVRCGTPLAEVEEALAAHGQMLAFEPPAFGDAATIGGVVAAGLSGPRRASAGSARDFVLGATIVDAQARVLRFGGQVMKNVAGYDVSRLMCGSLGILGPIVDVSLKVVPRPMREASVRFALEASEAIGAMNRWCAEPLPISATRWREGEAWLRFSGATPAVEAALARFERERGATRIDDDEAAHRWRALREHDDPFFAGGEALWRLSLPSTAPWLDLPGAVLVEWTGAQRWLRGDAPAARIRAECERVGGAATLFRGGDRSAGVFPPLPEANRRVHRELKRAFDPTGLFNRGRMYPDL
ncbi:MAG: glycolate oxidase subunit GlcE [Burkholderiales bacterium]|jgi:glycolate oxidase FAD binding subunit|nr:MAG: glycolate oxidase subunit GlcE [Burkholderiales bacterium]